MQARGRRKGIGLPLRTAIFLGALIAATVSDQWSKHLVFRALEAEQAQRELQIIPGALSLRLSKNEGGLFGFFQGQNSLLALVSAGALAAIFIAFLKSRSGGSRHYVALGLLAGGALGNLIDRVAFSSVRDFISFYLIHWPIFNLADAFLCIGVGLIGLEIIAGQKPEREPA